MTEADLKQRTFLFGKRVINLVQGLPNSLAARHLGDQLLRSAVSVGANYRAACRGRSKAEFIAKLGIVEEEADETGYWLELLAACGILSPPAAAPLIQESRELTAIMVASRKSAAAKPNSPLQK